MSDGLATHRYKAVEMKPGKWKVFENVFIGNKPADSDASFYMFKGVFRAK